MFTLDRPHSESLRRLTALHHDSHHYYKDTPSGGRGTNLNFELAFFITELLILIHTAIITSPSHQPT